MYDNTKMTNNRRCASDIQRHGEEEGFIAQVPRVNRSNCRHQQPLVDVVVATISIPLLIVFSLMLQNSMKRDWIHDFDARWKILGLGLSLLLISLVVCLYVTHRLGFCIWAAQQQSELDIMTETRRRIPLRSNMPGPVMSTGSTLQLMVNGELPPSYDSVMRNSDLPPPYVSILVYHDKISNSTRVNRSSLNLPLQLNKESSSRNRDDPAVLHQLPAG